MEASFCLSPIPLVCSLWQDLAERLSFLTPERPWSNPINLESPERSLTPKWWTVDSHKWMMPCIRVSWSFSAARINRSAPSSIWSSPWGLTSISRLIIKDLTQALDEFSCLPCPINVSCVFHRSAANQMCHQDSSHFFAWNLRACLWPRPGIPGHAGLRSRSGGQQCLGLLRIDRLSRSPFCFSFVDAGR